MVSCLCGYRKVPVVGVGLVNFCKKGSSKKRGGDVRYGRPDTDVMQKGVTASDLMYMNVGVGRGKGCTRSVQQQRGIWELCRHLLEHCSVKCFNVSRCHDGGISESTSV
jgi:hypothetical protein